MLWSIPEEMRDECWWFVRRDGTAVAGDAGGGIGLLLELRLTRPLGWVLRASPAGRAFDAIDKLVAGRRGRLGRVVPDGPAPRRYP